MNKNKQYYDISKVYKKAFDENSNFIFIYGGKSKGKSFQAKVVLMIEYYLKTGQRFALLRRYDEEVDKSKTELYFRDVLANIDLMAMTDNKYNSIACISSKIYFTHVNEAAKVTRKEHIGYAISLNREQNFSSILSEKDIDNIIFEEFQSRTTYLTGECDKLDFLYSTIDRERGTTKIWFMGNAISKACPYWQHFGILDIVKKQENATIESHVIEGKKILLEKTPVFNNKKTTVGTAAGAIANGDWYATPQRRTKQKGHKRGMLFVRFNFDGLLFLGELCMTEQKVLYWKIRSVEYFNDNKSDYLVTNKLIKPSNKQGSSIYTIGGERFREIAQKTFVEDKLYYSTNETGTDFRTACTFRIRS